MTLTALLLSGGLSRRMGRDKVTLLYEGEALWARQLRLLQKLEAEAVWISARENPDWAPENLTVILDDQPSRGPLSGVCAGLNRMDTSHLLVLAVDLPGMTLEFLRKLHAMAPHNQGVVPLNGNYFEPLVAIYPKQAAGIARASLGSGDVSMQSFVRELIPRQLVIPYHPSSTEAALFQNINTPQDLNGSNFS